MAASIASSARAPAEHRFFVAMALAIAIAVFVGFARSFFLRPLFPDWQAPPEAIFYVHGAAFSVWIVLLVVQVTLVAGGRTNLHRRLGVFGALLAVAMAILGTTGALIAARRPTGFIDVPVPPLQFLAVPLFDMMLFVTFVAFGLRRRRQPQHHKRLMLLATITLTTAAIARWPVVDELGPLGGFGLTDVFVVVLALWDWRALGRLHPVTLWGGLALVVSQPLRLVLSETEPWLAFARWATGLLG